MEILLRRFDRFMPEPKCNDGEVDTVLQERHGGGMAQGMWCNLTVS